MIILLLALLCIGWEISLPYRTPVLVIGTQEIFSDEWQEFLQQQKSAVTVYYTQNYGCTVFDDAFVVQNTMVRHRWTAHGIGH